MKLTETVNLKIDEAALTGESTAVDKDAGTVLEGKVALGDRINMAYASTNVTYGRGEGIVVATAMETEMGKIAAMLSGEKEGMTPLQKRLADLGKLLGFVAIGICVLLFVVAMLQKRDLTEMLLTAISLAVAAVPEGLPATVTIVLALGVQRMAKVNTIVRKLPAVETLGAVSVVCSDKTGTLTQNKMTVTKIYVFDELREVEALDQQKDALFLEGFVLCNDAVLEGDKRLGDPTELALLDMGLKFGLDRSSLQAEMPRINEQAFDSERKLMTTVHQRADKEVIAYTKGAVDVMLAGRCINIYDQGQVRPITEADKARIRAASDAMADTALRVLALAYEENDDSADEEGITFIGLVGMIDPPREEAKTSVEAFKRASIKTVMITGDHKNTAFAIAKELGIAERMEQCITGQEIDQMSQEELNEHAQDLCVFARVSPENKVAIVKAYQSNGQIVSMTGDGVNDAPSLKAADIGVAMGITGTEVSKGAADMVLADDNFSTIEKAVEEGRTIYNNIRKSVVFLLSSNWGEIVSMFVAIVLGLAAPLRAVHILWVNLITDTLPGLALGVDAKERDVMGAPPRDSNESLFAGGKMKIIGINGLIIGLATLGAFLYVPVSALLRSGTAISLTAINTALASELVRAQTYAFVTLALSQLFYAVGMRSFETPVFKMNHKSNRLMILAFVLGIGLQVCVTTIPALNTLFSTTSLGLLEWIGLLLVSTIPLWFNELIFKTKERHRHQ